MMTEGLSVLEFSTARHTAPFHQRRTVPGAPMLQRLLGYIIVSDGDVPERILRGHTYAPGVYENGEWRVESLWFPKASGGTEKQASRFCIRQWAEKGRLAPVGWCSTFKTVSRALSRVYPGLRIPEEKEFWEEFGLELAGDGSVRNPRGLLSK